MNTEGQALARSATKLYFVWATLSSYLHVDMPGDVEVCLGSAFGQQCDLLVIPTSDIGAVDTEVDQGLREAKIPFPRSVRTEIVTLADFTSPQFKAIAYVTVVRGKQGSEENLWQIGARLGLKMASLLQSQQRIPLGIVSLARLAVRAFFPPRMTAAMPLLATHFADLDPQVVARALGEGFLSTAPDQAVLMLYVSDQANYQAAACAWPDAPPLVTPPPRPISDGSDLDPAVENSDSGPKMFVAAPPQTSGPVSGLESDTTLQARQKRSTSAPNREMTRTRVFISYSHADAWWLERLQKHLKPLQREGVVVWDDTRLKAGEQWREEIRQALAATKVAILLISADFMASDFIDKNELPPLLQAAEEDGATILPVIINHCRFVRTPSLSRFQAVNDPTKPLAQMNPANREKVLDYVARAVEDALNR